MNHLKANDVENKSLVDLNFKNRNKFREWLENQIEQSMHLINLKF